MKAKITLWDRIYYPVIFKLEAWAERYMKSRKQDFIIGGEENPYLLRWWVIPRNRLFNIYLHKFLRSDDDRALHDHPWVNMSILLQGQYLEHMPATKDDLVGLDRRWRMEGDIVLRPPTARHRVELASVFDGNGKEVEIPTISLFITGPKMRDWGFWCPRGFVPWEIFCDDKDTGKVGRGCN